MGSHWAAPRVAKVKATLEDYAGWPAGFLTQVKEGPDNPANMNCKSVAPLKEAKGGESSWMTIPGSK
jgi:hypothetical protein